jgi:NAD(P)-dependent dehydrogenase (short-subunit alcohol dehydrogenase family)
MPELAGRVALVTGAAHGQGRATALALAAEGAAIVALDIAQPLDYPGYAMGSSDELQSLVAACIAAGAPCAAYTADVRDDAAVTRAVDGAVERFGRIDILFNNAGICAYGLAHELTEAAWDTMLDINLKGAWLVARRVIPVMIAQRSGVIINNSSVAGLRGMGRLSHYAASKWGLTGLTKSWAIELAPHNIRVNAIAPGTTDTAQPRYGNTDAELIEIAKATIPLGGKLLAPDQIARSAVFLASDEADAITGQVLHVNGGSYMP